MTIQYGTHVILGLPHQENMIGDRYLIDRPLFEDYLREVNARDAAEVSAREQYEAHLEPRQTSSCSHRDELRAASIDIGWEEGTGPELSATTDDAECLLMVRKAGAAFGSEFNVGAGFLK